MLVVLLDDAGFAASSAFGGPCETPTAERLAASGLQVQPVPHDGAVLADAAALLTGRNHHSVGMGVHHRDRHVGAGLQPVSAQHGAPLAETLQAERLLDGAVRQVP